MSKNISSIFKKISISDDNIMLLLFAFILLVVIMAACALVFAYSSSMHSYFLPFKIVNSNTDISELRAQWGQFGDFFGGTLNPLFGFISLFALLMTIVYQARSLRNSSEELRLSREELSKSSNALAAQNKAIELQSFEQTFFSWLSTYKSLLSSIEDESIHGFLTNNREIIVKNGRTQLHKWWSNALNEVSIWNLIHKKSKENNLIPESSFREAYKLKPTNREEQHYVLTIANLHHHVVGKLILTEWDRLYYREEYQLDSLFRTLYSLLIWIDSQQDTRLSSAQKWLYVSIVRGQLSWIEMVYFYFNGLRKPGNKFKQIAEKYALFNNLTFESDAGIQVLKNCMAYPDGYKLSAYDSEVARAKLRLPITSEETLALATSSPLAAPSA